MKNLLILRHAKSSWSHPNLSDHDRPLNKRGKRDAPRMGQLLAKEGLTPDVIISSTAKRARTTAETVAETCGSEGELITTRDFYHGYPEEYLHTLRQVSNKFKTVMVVGHNPGMEELIDTLTGESVRFTTANIAHVRLPIKRWKDLDDEVEGTLANLWRPKEI